MVHHWTSEHKYLRFLFFLGFDVFNSPSFIFLYAHLTPQRQALILVFSQAHALFQLKGNGYNTARRI